MLEKYTLLIYWYTTSTRRLNASVKRWVLLRLSMTG